jgi:hypothetical protein
MFCLESYNFSSFAELPKVRWVLPDSYLDVKNKDYGGNDYMFPILIYIYHHKVFRSANFIMDYILFLHSLVAC